MIKTNGRGARPAGRRRVLLAVPNVARDLEGHALLAYHLQARHGFDVRLCEASKVTDAMLAFAPDGLMLNQLTWHSDARDANLAKKLGARLFVLPNSGLWPTQDAYLRLAGSVTGANILVDCWLSWGPAMTGILTQNGVLDPSQVQDVGCVRFDLYGDHFVSPDNTRAEFAKRLGISDPAAPLICWATGTHFHRVANVAAEAAHRAAIGGIPPEETLAEREDDHTQFDDLSQVVLTLARQHPEWRFVIRVHPGEIVQGYRDLVQGLTNVHFATDMPIRDVLRHSDVLLQRWSTTAVEAWILEKPVLEVTAGRYHAPAPPEFLAGNDVVSRADEAERLIRGYLEGKPLAPEQRAARRSCLERLLYRIDFRAAERAAEAIAQHLGEPRYGDQDQARVREATEVARRRQEAASARQLGNRVKDLLGISRDSSLRFWRDWRNGGRAREAARAGAKRGITEDAVRSLHDIFGRALRTDEGSGC